jgi:hypothetical protein
MVTKKQDHGLDKILFTIQTVDVSLSMVRMELL